MTSPLHDRIQRALSEHEDELIELHRALVRIPTVNRGEGASADEVKVAQAGADYLQAADIDSRIVAGQPGRGNLLAEVGTGGRAMLWMSHSDVVPAGDEAAWTHPPFSAALVDGRIWGRGANDCKMLVAAQLFTLAQLKRLGLPARGRLRLAVGADEEVGGRWGFGYLFDEHRDFLKADLAICEGGGGTLGRFGEGRPVVSFGAGEKGRYDVTLRAKAPGGHASSPWGKRNPLVVLTGIIQRIHQWSPQPVPASPIFANVGAWAGMNEPITPRNVDQAIGRIETLAPSLATSLKGQSRMTLTPTVLHAGDKANAIPTEATLVCDARLLPGQTLADLELVLKELVPRDEGIEQSIQESSEPSVSPVDESLATMFKRAATRALGIPVEVSPTWCIGATDAHYVRSAGTPVYGFQLIHPDADPKRLGIHCINESIEARMLLPCALALAHLAAEYLGE